MSAVNPVYRLAQVMRGHFRRLGWQTSKYLCCEWSAVMSIRSCLPGGMEKTVTWCFHKLLDHTQEEPAHVSEWLRSCSCKACLHHDSEGNTALQTFRQRDAVDQPIRSSSNRQMPSETLRLTACQQRAQTKPVKGRLSEQEMGHKDLERWVVSFTHGRLLLSNTSSKQEARNLHAHTF